MTGPRGALISVTKSCGRSVTEACALCETPIEFGVVCWLRHLGARETVVVCEACHDD